jgi:TRAP transporter TAXI family solute receptor
MATGGEDGAYYFFGRQYRDILARQQVTLEVRRTSGSGENIALLQAAEVDVAFVQSGVWDAAAPTSLVALTSVYLEPLWLFYHRDLEVKRLPDLRGKRLAMGPEGSGTRAMALQLLRDNAMLPPAVEILSLSGPKAVQALRRGEADAVFVVASAQAPVVRTLFKVEEAVLMPFERAEAYTRVHRFLAGVTLPEGAIDFATNVPPHDVPLLAPAATLVVRHNFHPALVSLLIQAAEEVHGQGDLFAQPGQFPSPHHLDFPLSPEARRYFESGPSFLRRYLPFWIATLIERMLVMCLPLVALFIPLVRFLPPLYQWRVRSRIYRWYGDILAVDPEWQAGDRPEQYADDLRTLDRLEAEVARLSVPLAFADQLYNLRMHIELVRQRVRQAQTEVNREKTLETRRGGTENLVSDP